MSPGPFHCGDGGCGGWYAAPAEDCPTKRNSDIGECCFYLEAYCDCPDGDRLRARDGKPAQWQQPTPAGSST